MSIASEITRINSNIAAAYTALDGKGATLPAAGSQNSANLADTIDTITTGGGGSTVVRGTWVVPQVFLNLDAEVTSYGEASQVGTVVGYHFVKSLLNDNKVYYQRSGNTLLYPDVTPVQEDNTYNSITLPQDCDTVIISNSSASGISNEGLIPSLGGQGNDTYNLSYAIDYMTVYVVNPDSTHYFMLYSFGGWLHECHALTNGVKYNWFYFPQLSTMSYLPSVTEVTYSGNWAVASPFKEFAMLPNLPYGMDFSSKTDDWDFSVDTTTANGNNLYRRPRLTQMYVTLPNANVTMNGKPSYWNKYGILLTADNWSYIASHAPTVSGKTLSINQINMDRLGATNKATLEGKGWTVSLVS